MNALGQDIRFGFRLLARRPWATFVAVLALALGIGANAALFSAVDAVLLRPFPFTDQDRLVVVWEKDLGRGMERVEVSYPNFTDWRREATSFEQLAAMPNAVSEEFLLTGLHEPVSLHGSSVSANFFDLLGARPARGRSFRPEEDHPGAPRVVVVSHGISERQLGGDAAAVGKTVTLNGTPFTIVGVMPAGFDYPSGAELWTPIVPSHPELVNDRSTGWLQIVGRLRPGVTSAAALAEMDGIVRRLAVAYEKSAEGRGAVVTPIVEDVLGKTRPALVILMAAVAVVLLIACANVASLLLSQAAARRRETAIRLALGAGRGRILRQRLVETLILAALGAIAGLVCAAWGLGALLALAPAEIPRLEGIAIDRRVLLFTLAISLLAALAAGLVPALHAARSPVEEALRDGARGALGGLFNRRWRNTLVAAEAGLALIVLVGAGLLTRSFARLQDVPLGFDPKGTLTFGVSLPQWKYQTLPEQRRFFDSLLERVRALPGVEAAGAVQLRPLELGPIGISAWVLREGQATKERETNPAVNYEVVTPGYFRAMGIPLRAGREFDERDTDGASPVVVVGESTARRLWPGEEPVGKRIATHGTPKEKDGSWRWATVVGLVPDVRYRGLTDVRLDLYVPFGQSPFPVQYVVIRTTSDPAPLASAIRQAVSTLDKDLPITGVASLGAIVDGALGGPRFRAVLIAAFACLALLLAAVGIWGVVAWSVAQRTQEIGLRMALGARAPEVVRHVVAQGVVPALAGVAVGLVVAWACSRALRTLLFGIPPDDPSTFMAVAALLLLVATGASLLPARRAARLDPVAALREE
ncbi:MAG: ABC transporter permease [Solirubrobacterales bacterium]